VPFAGTAIIYILATEGVLHRQSPMVARSFIFACFLLPQIAAAQIEFGMKGGLNISDIVMTNYINPDVESDLRLKAGLHAGFFASGMMNERIGLTGEVLYSNKGVKANGNIDLHYVTVPLLVQYRLSSKIFLEVGPEIGYMFSATSDFGNATSNYNNKLDLGLDGGLRLAADRFNFGLRYCVGMLSVRDPIEFNNTSGSERIKFQNRVLQFSVGYRLWTDELYVTGRRQTGAKFRRYRGAFSKG